MVVLRHSQTHGGCTGSGFATVLHINGFVLSFSTTATTASTTCGGGGGGGGAESTSQKGCMLFLCYCNCCCLVKMSLINNKVERTGTTTLLLFLCSHLSPGSNMDKESMIRNILCLERSTIICYWEFPSAHESESIHMAHLFSQQINNKNKNGNIYKNPSRLFAGNQMVS